MSLRDPGIPGWQTNAFYVLDLPVECTRAEVERAGQKLLGLLELGVASARTFATPFGQAERTPEKVRTAMAELRDPAVRISHEVWARVPTKTTGGDATPASALPAPLPTWDEVMAALGWRGL